MKTKIILLLAFGLLGLNGWSQVKIDKVWAKDPATSTYSLEYEQKMRDDFYKQNQKKYASNVDMYKIDLDVKSINEEQRLNAIKILGLIPSNNQIPSIENLLVNDPSLTVRMECAKSLKYLKSTASIPVLINALKADDQQLKLEIALTLAALGEKTECLKTLNEIGKTGERNVILDTHLGYLDIATGAAVEKLKNDLLDTNPYISVDAAIVLSELGYSEVAFPVLKTKLSNEDKFIRMAALRGLAYIGNEKSIDLIWSMLNDGEYLVRDRSELILKITMESSAVAAYNPAAAANYAEQWWNLRNVPMYLDYNGSGGNDCANFVSQCLKAGGISLNAGPGLDDYGCIPFCDNLHINFTTHQGCTLSSSYSGHKTSGYPSWFVQGDVAMFGSSLDHPTDPWEHAAINVVTGTPALDAHTNDRHQVTVGWYYPQSVSSASFKTGDFYHFSSTGSSPPSNDEPCNADPLTVGSSCNYVTKTINGATKSTQIPDAACDQPSNVDVWFKFTIPSGTFGIHTNSISISGNDCGLSIYTGSCSSLTERECIKGGNPSQSYMPWKDDINLSAYSGQTGYIRLWEFGTVSQTGDFQICVVGATTNNCTITSINPSAETHNPESFSTTSGEEIIINAQANCTFNVTENCSWLTVTPMSGTTNSVKQALLNYSIQANTTTTARQCTFYVNDSPITITQNGCTFDFATATKSVSASGSTYNLDIDSYSPCSWSIQNNCSWVHPSQLSGTGDPTITVTVDPNNSCESRTCTLTINPGNATHVITQQSNIIAPTSPNSATASQMAITSGQSTTLQVVGGALNSAPNWVWYTGSCGGSIAGTGSTLVVSPTVTTTYYVQATACANTTICRSVTINILTSLNETSASEKIKINPNPTTGLFEISGIEALEGACKIEIFNNLGYLIYISEYEKVGNKIGIDLKTYPTGIYMIKLSNMGVTYQKKVIKK